MGAKRIGKYLIKDILGHGGMGTVYRAWDPVIEREVAIKVVQERVMSPAAKQRFYREAKSAGRLSHENIMTVYDVGEQEGSPYLVMELLGGTNLRRVLEERSLVLSEKLDIALQICRGLAYAHQKRVIHRDIKPENIQILEDGRVKIMDFGLARVETDTLTHTSMGTPRYMSPEQVKGEQVDQRTDIFSFGVLFYELLTGANPFSGERVSTILYKIVHENPEPLRIDDDLLGDELQRIVSRCIEKAPDRRYPSFDAVIEDIEDVVADRYSGRTLTRVVSPAASGKASPEIRASSGDRDSVSGLSWMALGVVVVLAVVGGSYLVFQSGQFVTDDSTPGLKTGLLEESPAVESDIGDHESDVGDRSDGQESEVSEDMPEETPVPPVQPREESDEAEVTAPDPAAGNPSQETGSGGGSEDERAQQQEQERLQRAQADRIRQSMEEARRNVAERHHEPSNAADYRRAETLRAAGEKQYKNEAFTTAIQSFREAETFYEGIPERAEPDPEPSSELAVTGDRAETDRVRAEMLAAKQKVRSALHQKPSYARALQLERQGGNTYETKDFERALEYFREAEALFAKVAAMLTPREEVENSLQDLTAQLKSSLEEENTDGLYALSPFYAEKTWTEFFRFVKNVSAVIRTGDITVDDSAATVVVTVRLQYLNNKNERQDSQFDYVWSLENTDGSIWRLVNVENK